MNLYISIATKISISFFLVVFLFSAFYFMFFGFNLVLAEDQEAICDQACAHLEGAEQDDCFNNCIAGSISATCDKYGYPWCSEAKEGIAPLVNNFYKIALGLAGASALGVLIYGSILWTLSGAVSSKQDAKEWISGALWGLALLLGAYLILWTINPQLTILKDPMAGAPEVKVSAPAPETRATGGFAGSKWPLGAPPSGTYFDAQGRSALAPGVSANNLNCTYVGQRNCTSFDGISESIIQNTNDLQKAAGVPIVITGGTEYWLHSEGTEHKPGGKAIDYRYDPAVLKAVQNSGKVSKYQCEFGGIKVYGCVGTIDHIHVEY